MAENFQEAPLPLCGEFHINDCVALISFPLGDPPERYKLSVKITTIDDDIYQGVISVVENADNCNKPGNVFRRGSPIHFRRGNIQGMASGRVERF
ncbi:hypothetical protein [Martelella alba]|uniref:Uncharacterized protein n=1 Tax=Martelella alba TaxID=2590451 RepID=A0ABY2SNQ4_9HYPH|nr:hypothetical protein [Martelella alba]TKI07656.1 hypothetical protein FCN80_04210 [Martelella alba]